MDIVMLPILCNSQARDREEIVQPPVRRDTPAQNEALPCAVEHEELKARRTESVDPDAHAACCGMDVDWLQAEAEACSLWQEEKEAGTTTSPDHLVRGKSFSESDRNGIICTERAPSPEKEAHGNTHSLWEWLLEEFAVTSPGWPIRAAKDRTDRARSVSPFILGPNSLPEDEHASTNEANSDSLEHSPTPPPPALPSTPTVGSNSGYRFVSFGLPEPATEQSVLAMLSRQQTPQHTFQKRDHFRSPLLATTALVARLPSEQNPNPLLTTPFSLLQHLQLSSCHAEMRAHPFPPLPPKHEMPPEEFQVALMSEEKRDTVGQDIEEGLLRSMGWSSDGPIDQQSTPQTHCRTLMRARVESQPFAFTGNAASIQFGSAPKVSNEITSLHLSPSCSIDRYHLEFPSSRPWQHAHETVNPALEDEGVQVSDTPSRLRSFGAIDQHPIDWALYGLRQDQEGNTQVAEEGVAVSPRSVSVESSPSHRSPCASSVGPAWTGSLQDDQAADASVAVLPGDTFGSAPMIRFGATPSRSSLSSTPKHYMDRPLDGPVRDALGNVHATDEGILITTTTHTSTTTSSPSPHRPNTIFRFGSDNPDNRRLFKSDHSRSRCRSHSRGRQLDNQCTDKASCKWSGYDGRAHSPNPPAPPRSASADPLPAVAELALVIDPIEPVVQKFKELA
ncbi:hypothetical protein BAUCODRAFT_402284 [Baudoinia panamericana UAMH 10762]|uniref:Uncharacterized protein n=1 Tax=Baudoinia panamericana (strain UAMH 10762) TaxID=717646 RepID=M2MRD3_BAUPA|nr:uncharacterized protein BAUCODRAFT_402284 [Baudoinia panamericana UAMH 10762]EMC99401.1 hypothetical protein BAUCODRAFT_402284 [Baudoinia panamericana UAMH 10762]